MNQIVFVLLFISVVYVKLINSQLLTSCQRAQQNLDGNQICVNASIDGNNASLVCNGTCRGLYDAVIGVCGGTTALRNTIYGLCDPCGIPLVGLSTGDPSCTNHIIRRNVTAICMGRCRSLLEDLVANCPNTTVNYNVLDEYCTPCGMARTNLDANTECRFAYSSARDASAVCSGTCRTLGDAIVANCDASISSTYANTINTLCSGDINTGCNAALQALEDEASCHSATMDPSVICSGTCSNLYFAVVDACPDLDADTAREAYNRVCDAYCATTYAAINASCRDMLNNNALTCTSSCGTALSTTVTACRNSTDPQIRAVILAYNQQCGSGSQCNAALQALENEPSCQSMDPRVACSGTCSTLYFATIDACPDLDAGIAREAYNRVCGSGSILKASGIITLLFVAMQALILK